MKIYISGPVTGIEDNNRKAFHEAVFLWECQGWNAINPLETEPENPTWELCLRKDIALLLGCDAIAMLPGWMDSRGARLEHFIARQLCMTVYNSTTRTILTVPSMYERGGLYMMPEDAKPITEQAHNLVQGARRNVYGHPLDDYTRTAQLFSGILGTDVTAEQAILMMIAVKVSRLTNSPDHRDSIIDVAGYAECLDLVREERKNRERVDAVSSS